MKIRISLIALVTCLVGFSAHTSARPDRRDERVSWRHLANGKLDLALDGFLEEVARRRDDGSATIGYALTVGALGDLPRAAQAMRYALHTNPQTFRHLPIDLALLPRLDTLVLRVQIQLEEHGLRRNSVLFLGALHYLRGDHDATRWALDLSTALGDGSVARGNLESLIRRPAGVTLASMTSPVDAPDADPPASTTQTQTQTRRQPVDYESLRMGIQALSDTLDRFTRKLIARVALDDQGLGQTAPEHAVPSP